MNISPEGQPEPIHSDHRVDEFDCGEAELNTFLQRNALSSHRGGGARTFVLVYENNVVAYYSLAVTSVSSQDVSARIAAGQRADSIPVMLIARIAVDESRQGQQIGSAMLKDALKRIAAASEAVGGRAVLVHAKNDRARRFYEYFNFEPSPTNKYHLLLLMKDLRKMMGLPPL